jgi:hypothetical protein
MTKDEIIEMAKQAGFEEHQAKFDTRFEPFAKLVAEKERERIYLEQMQLPEPRLTGKFLITAGKFKCTGCTGTWTDRDDAKHHSCKDYQ